MAIANAVRANRSLHTLSLRACGFPLNTVIAIATTLRQNATLRSLQLDRPILRYPTSPSHAPSFCAFAYYCPTFPPRVCSTRQEEGTDHLARLLTNTVSRLEALSLRYHNVGYAASPPALYVRHSCYSF